MIFVIFYKIQFIIFAVLIIFRLERPIINRRKRIYWQTIRRDRIGV